MLEPCFINPEAALQHITGRVFHALYFMAALLVVFAADEVLEKHL